MHKTKYKKLYSLLRIKIARLRESVYDIGKLKERHPEAKTDKGLKSKLKAQKKQASFQKTHMELWILEVSQSWNVRSIRWQTLMSRSFARIRLTRPSFICLVSKKILRTESKEAVRWADLLSLWRIEWWTWAVKVWVTSYGTAAADIEIREKEIISWDFLVNWQEQEWWSCPARRSHTQHAQRRTTKSKDVTIYGIYREEQIMGFFTELTRARMMELSGEKIAYAARAKKNH